MGNDSEPSMNSHEPDCEAWLSARDAAERLGISKRAVQLRIQRGKITHKWDGEKFLVCLDAVEGASEAGHEQAGESAVNSGVNSHESVHGELVETLRSEVAFLRERLVSADVEKSELRRLLLMAEQRAYGLQEKVRLLEAAPVEDAVQDAQETQTSVQRPRKWWQWWRREEE